MTFQDVLKPVVVCESLQARILDAAQQLENILRDVPPYLGDVRTRLQTSLNSLNDSMHDLRLCTQVGYFDASHNLSTHYRQQGSMPEVSDVAFASSDGSSFDTEEEPVTRAD